MTKFDSTLLRFETLAVLDPTKNPGSELHAPHWHVYHLQVQTPSSLVSNRDFMIMNKTLYEGDRAFRMGVSVVHDELPNPEYGFVRGQVMLSGFFAEKREDGVYLININHSNPMGWVPAWLVNATLTKYAQNVAKVREWVEQKL
jgi:hypothetical protein